MKKSIKRFLKIFPGGKKFIQNYKNLLIENGVLREECRENKRCDDKNNSAFKERNDVIFPEDYKVFFHR